MNKLALLSNVNMDILKGLLAPNYDIYSPPGYGAWYEDVLNFDSGIYQYRPTHILFLFDANEVVDKTPNWKEIKQEFSDEIRKVDRLIENFPNSQLYISTIDILQRRILPLSMVREERIVEWEWYSNLIEESNKNKNVFIFDIKRIIEELGREKFYDEKMWYIGGIPYSIVAMRKIAEEISLFIKASNGERKKCLVIDLDNTLWGGVVGEDGVQNLVLANSGQGAIYFDIQKRLKEIEDTGVILAIVSKNNYEDAIKVISKHSGMVLREDDFVQIYANWNKKADNVRALAKTLNIGLDSIVFLDDNPAEQEEMKALLPEVTIIDTKGEKIIFQDVVDKAYRNYFLAYRLTDEDKKRTSMYQSEKKRKEDFQATNGSLEDYIKNLGIEVTIEKGKDEDIERISQLTQKTNQFNVTTKRYTIDEIRNLMKRSDIFIYIIRTSDRYGDNGLTLVVIVKVVGSEAYIDEFLMSCRVMGRKIEKATLFSIENSLKKEDIKKINAIFIPTSKNAPAASFFSDAGYKEETKHNDGSIEYSKILEKENNIVPYIKVRSKF